MSSRPFRGLEPYSFRDHKIFGGREEELEDLWELVSRYRACLLLGSSGAGKSSMVNAGLLPRLREIGITVDRVRYQPIPDEEFLLEAIHAGKEDGDLLPSGLRCIEGSEKERVSAQVLWERIAVLPQSPRALLIFDQFEEFVTFTDNASNQEDAKSAQNAALELLLKLYGAHTTAAKVLFVFRQEYLARLDFFLDRCPGLFDQQLRLQPPATTKLEKILSKPFEVPNSYPLPDLSLELRDRLAEQFTKAAGGRRLKLSEVQMAALQLYDHHGDRDALLTEKGIGGLIGEYLKVQLSRLTTDRDTATAIMSVLITKEGTRRFLSLNSILAEPIVHEDRRNTKAKIKAVLSQLTKEDLLRCEQRGNDEDESMYEIVSEYLVPWIKQQREIANAKLLWEQKKRFIAKIAIAVFACGVVVALVFYQLRVAKAKYLKTQDERGNLSSAAKANYVAEQLKSCNIGINSPTNELASTYFSELVKPASPSTPVAPSLPKVTSTLQPPIVPAPVPKPTAPSSTGVKLPITAPVPVIAPPTPTVVAAREYIPFRITGGSLSGSSAMAVDKDMGIFFIDKSGEVFQLKTDDVRVGHTLPLFSMGNHDVYSLAASGGFLYAMSTNGYVCNVTRYEVGTGKREDRSVVSKARKNGEAGRLPCQGIAAIGKSVYIAMPSDKSFYYWTDWSNSSMLSTNKINMFHIGGTLSIDPVNRQLDFLGDDGSFIKYGIDSDGTPSFNNVLTHLPKTTIISLSTPEHPFAAAGSHLFIAVGNEIRGYDPVSGTRDMSFLVKGFSTPGKIVALAVTSEQSLWVLDATGDLTGPFDKRKDH